MPDDIEGLRAQLDAVNRARLGLAADDGGNALEAALEAAFEPATKLAIYGTLAPGKVNHHHIAELGGEWRGAAVRGSLGAVPCGVHQALPAMVLDPAASPHPLQVLVCQRLADAWARLDAFEGAEMQRLLVPLEGDGGVTGVANIYALRRAMVAALG